MKSRMTAFIIDETQIQIASAEAWLWVSAEPNRHRIEVYIQDIEIY